MKIISNVPTEWWKQIEARDRAEAEARNRYVEQMKALQRERAERENRERVAAWEASQARDRAERERAAELNDQIRREMAEQMAREAARRETAEREAAERAHEPPVGMPSGWRVPELK
jgi:hypothetical protein